VSGPADLREELRELSTPVLIAVCSQLEVIGPLRDPDQAHRLALRRLARRHQQLTAEITAADADLKQLVTAAAPRLLELVGVGIEVAGQLLTTAGDNRARMRSEAAFAHLCGVAPTPASSGRPAATGSTAAATEARATPSTRSRSVDCAAIPAPAATSTDAPPRGLTKPEIIRCLKRYLAREIYQVLLTPSPSSSSRPPQRSRRAGQP
jgi:hypothetical protein